MIPETPSGPLGRVFAELRTARAWDVQIPGFIDRDGRYPRFTPMSATAYVALEEGYLRLDSVGNHGQLALRLVSEVEVPEALEGEDEEFSLASFGEPFLADAHSDFRVTRIRWAVNDESDSLTGTVRCAEFEFENSWPLFVDPGWHFGIRLQGAGAFDRWLADNRDSGRGVQEFSWVP